MGHIFSRETGVSEIASENRDADDEITDASVNNTNSEEFSDHLTPSNGNSASNENTEQSASGSVKNQQELAGRDEGLVSDATTESSAVKPGDFKGFKTKNEDTIMNILKKQPGESIKDYGDRLDKSLKPLTLALGVLSSGVGLTSMVMSVENHEESEKKDDTSSSSENSGSDTLPYISKAPDLNQV